MNPLTQIRNTQKISKQEILQEGDVLTVFAQYGELVDVHNVKDRDTGKYRGFSFLAYEDQRSTVLAVDNLNGATVGGRTVRVEHVDNYKKKKAEVEGREESESEEEEDGEPEELPLPPQAAASLPPSASAGDKGDMPWAASGSIFSMLNDPSTAQPPAAAQLPPKHKSHKKDKKEKTYKRHKDQPRPNNEAHQDLVRPQSVQAGRDNEDMRHQGHDNNGYANGAGPHRVRSHNAQARRDDRDGDAHTESRRQHRRHSRDRSTSRDRRKPHASDQRPHSHRDQSNDRHDSRRHSSSRHDR